MSPTYLKPLAQVELIDGEQDEPGHQTGEDHEFVAEGGSVLLLESVVKTRVPRVEQHRNADLGEFDRKNGPKESATSPPILRSEIGQRKSGDLSDGTTDPAHEWHSHHAVDAGQKWGARTLLESPLRGRFASAAALSKPSTCAGAPGGPWRLRSAGNFAQ